MPTGARTHRPKVAAGRTHRVERKREGPSLYGAEWRRARADFLARHPLCAHCKAVGRITAAAVVDHITPHRGDLALFWQPENWQSLCVMHHNRKTASEDGGYGNAKR